jgi:hypothetical protein
VIIMSDTASAQSDCSPFKMIPVCARAAHSSSALAHVQPNIRQQADICAIKMNAIATTFLTKALNAILTCELYAPTVRRPLSAKHLNCRLLIKQCTDTAGEDIRQAIGELQVSVMAAV